MLAREVTMRISGVVVVMVTTITLIFLPSGLGSDAVAWGPTVNGLRLGAAFGSDPSNPTLRVVLQNVGSRLHELLIGRDAGRLVYDALKIIATAPGGKQPEFLHWTNDLPLGTRILPLSIRLKVGATHEIDLPLTDYASRTMVTLDVLVKQGYSVRVHFEGKAGATWADRSPTWIGPLTEYGWTKASPTWIGMLSSPEISPMR
jgi:hypothetical protein